MGGIKEVPSMTTENLPQKMLQIVHLRTKRQFSQLIHEYA